VHSDDGLDELSVSAPSTVFEVRDGRVVDQWSVDPGQLGIEHRNADELRGGDVEYNARRLVAVLGGEELSAASEAIALNAAAALYVGGVADDLSRGLSTARDVIATGAALDVLHRMAESSVEISNEC
jgi:anthranilate phosphoribosyltransferase